MPEVNLNDLREHQQKDFAQLLIAGPIMRVVITGPVGIGKTILADRIERLLKEEFHAETVMVSAEIRQEQNAMNMSDWRVSMADRMSKIVYTIDENTVAQVSLKDN